MTFAPEYLRLATRGHVVAIQPLASGLVKLIVATDEPDERHLTFTRRTFAAMLKHRGGSARVLTEPVTVDQHTGMTFMADRSRWPQAAERGFTR